MYSLKEEPKRAVESVILLAEEWGNENNGHWTEFFDQVSPSRATHFIITGRISPWIIYGTSAGQRLVDRLNEKELEIVVNHINVNTWKHKLKKYPASLNALEIIDETSSLTALEPTGDAQAVANFTWELLFLSPWELAYIAIPMAVLGFYGLSIYAMFKYIQKKFS